MTYKYPTFAANSPTVQEMPPVTATALKNSTADILDRVVTQGALAITRHDKPRAVLLSIEQYQQLTRGEESDTWLQELYEECYGMLDAMQSPEQKAAAERLFEATPEELGQAALRGYRNNAKNSRA